MSNLFLCSKCEKTFDEQRSRDEHQVWCIASSKQDDKKPTISSLLVNRYEDHLTKFYEANPAFFEDIFIPDYLANPYLTTGIRASSRLFRRPFEKPKKTTSLDLLRNAARTGNVDLCVYLKTRFEKKEAPINFNWRNIILCDAARGGHEHLCILAREWGANDWNGMLRGAAKCDHEHICILARKWSAKDWNGMLRGAAKCDHEHLCILAREWGANDWNDMLYWAAHGGHEHICHLAREWGANDWNDMLYWAAHGGHEHICYLARKWGANNWNGMLGSAAKGGYESICRLAREWGADDWNDMLGYAACGGYEHLCHLAREWGANDWNDMLESAAIGGHENICRLARKWGADWRLLLSCDTYRRGSDIIYRLASEDGFLIKGGHLD